MKDNFKNTVGQIVEKDLRYDAPAYEFVSSAVSHTVRKLNKNAKTRNQRHVSGGELIEGACEYAIREFGPLAADVLAFWGVNSGGDIGNIVYNMIDSGLLSANSGDSREDFNGRPDLLREIRSMIASAGNQLPDAVPPVID